MRVNNHKKSAVKKTHFTFLSIKTFVCALVLSGTALAEGTLSGTVVDAANGVTPVSPVVVDLINPITGEDLAGLTATTNAQGLYEITGIPPGDYKVIFNAVESANAYIDELYNDIPCDNGGCGMDLQGDVISIADDTKTLDVDLVFSTSLSRVEFNNQDLFLNGLNLAWQRFSKDIGPDEGTPDLSHFEDVFAQMQANGANSMRLWLHTTGQYTPEWDGLMVVGPGVDTISDLQNILDLAWQYDIGLIPCLWSHNMMEIAKGSAITDRGRAILTQPENRQSYIDNSLIPMVEALKGHPAIIAWEIFNEAEGMSDLTTWKATYHIPISNIQAFVNLAAGAIHRTDPDAKVTNGSIQGLSFLSDVGEGNYNYYSDHRLIEAGGDVDGTLDFYSAHFYSYGTSPFEHHASYWNLDKPLVLAEFHPDCEPVCGEKPFEFLYDNGYAGALSWSWTDRKPEQLLPPIDGLFNLHPEDVLIDRPGRPIVSLTQPVDQSNQNYGEARLSAEANNPDGSIVHVEFFIDSIKYGQDDSAPYEIDFVADEMGTFSAFAVAVDNDGVRGRSSTHSFTLKHLVEPGRLEAEDASYDTITRGEDPYASRGAYLHMKGDGAITWQVSGVPSAGNYDMTIGFNLNNQSPKTNTFRVNGGDPIDVAFIGETQRWRQKVAKVPLLEGDNTIVLTPSWGWMYFDYIAFSFLDSPGTLSGTVVDSTDNVTPVHPVIIDLIDPNSGEFLGIRGNTGQDGRWEIGGLAPGDYKILFNAVDTPTTAYTDELYDGVACTNGNCDVQNLGAAFTVVPGTNTLDVDLDPTLFLLSGTVTDEQGLPISGVQVEVFDDSGAKVGLNSSTDASGFWSYPVAVSGSYYIRTTGGVRDIYQNEVWNNIPCDGCDPVANGSVIVVTDGDVDGISFNLAVSSAYITIFRSGFEGDSILVTVPNVVGQQQATAEEILASLGLVRGNILNIASDTVPIDKIISQNPLAGSTVPIHSAVHINISSGRAKATVPNVVGLSLVTAGDAIVNASLKVGSTTNEFSDTVDVGDVISQTPVAGTLVWPESAVDLVVSAGPGIAVPDVTGQIQASAESAIIAATLIVGTVTMSNSNTVAEGSVISQLPVAGSLVAAGRQVDLVVSSGIGQTVSYSGPEPIDPAVIEQLPVDEDTGLPIAIALEGITLTLDLTKQDPITGWSQCTDWVVSCVNTVDGRDLDDCAKSVPSCTTSEPWLETETCCPSACYSQYRDTRLSGQNPFRAFVDVYLNDASCYPGVQEMTQ